MLIDSYWALYFYLKKLNDFMPRAKNTRGVEISTKLGKTNWGVTRVWFYGNVGHDVSC